MIIIYKDVSDHRSCFRNFICFKKIICLLKNFSFKLSKIIVGSNLRNAYYDHESLQVIANPNFLVHTYFIQFNYVKIFVICFK
jgi:hypothetical protein